MDETPDKDPIRFLEKHIIKHDRKYNLEIFATEFPNIEKWIANEDIENELCNEYWTNKHITDSQKTCLLELRHGQHMGNARKQLFFGRETYPSITCSICNSLEPHTWVHVLLNCRESHIHALETKRHNKAVWIVKELKVSSKHSRCYILMNVGTFNDNPPKNTVPLWLLPCTCGLERCHYNARCKPDVICVKGLPYQANPPNTLENNLTIQFIEFTYWNDRFSSETISRKTEKYQPFIDNITNKGWNVETVIVIIAGARATTHIPSMKVLEEKFKTQKETICETYTEINTIGVQHAMSIILQKRRVENNEPLSVDRNST